MKSLLAVAVMLCAFAGVLAASRQVTGLESALKAGDSTNGGFWDVSARVAATVSDGSSTVGAAVSCAAVSVGHAATDALDTRMSTRGESRAIALRTDVASFAFIIR